LGAEKRDVLRMMVGQGLKLAVVGVAAGLALAAGLSRFLSGIVYGVGTTDPPTFLAVPAILVAVAGLASYVPAWRATRVDPVTSLRAQ